MSTANEPIAASPARGVVLALGCAQTLAWGSSYYLPAILAAPMARELGVAPSWVFGAFSAALVVSALLGPAAGRAVDARGGRSVLAASSWVLAAGLALLGMAPSFAWLAVGWLVLGVGMAIGLYDTAFAALAGLFGHRARDPITGVTLMAGFASTVGWPLSAFLEETLGWRGACAVWAGLHLAVGWPLNRRLPRSGQAQAARADPARATPAAPTPRGAMPLLAFVFAATWFVTGAMAAHLPGLLAAAGASAAVAVTAGALIGPAQVAARLAEWRLLSRFHPVISARLATLGHPLGALALVALGGPAAAGAYALALLHGAGNGVLTIAKGTLPLAVFGPAGYGARLGLLSAPSRLLQALAPFVFGLAIERLGVGALAITAGLSLGALGALLLLRVETRGNPLSVGGVDQGKR